jgi:ABC-type transport system involved in multi-copper enzyme maturation permease subunit
MIRSELFKITHHRTPWVIGIVYAALVLIPSVYFIFKAPSSADQYLEVTSDVFGIAGLLLSAVFGAWVVGNEYRHGTMRRVVAIDARRGRLLATKAALSLGVGTIGLAAIVALGIGASTLVAGLHGDTLVFDGMWRTLAGTGFINIVTAMIAFALSVILMSDTYAMIGTLGVMVVFGPLVQLIPRIGSYTPWAVSLQISERIGQVDAIAPIALTTAILTLAATLAAAGIASARLFATRDI